MNYFCSAGTFFYPICLDGAFKYAINNFVLAILIEHLKFKLFLSHDVKNNAAWLFAGWIHKLSLLWWWKLWEGRDRGVRWLKWESSFWMIRTVLLWGTWRDRSGREIFSPCSSLRGKLGGFVDHFLLSPFCYVINVYVAQVASCFLFLKGIQIFKSRLGFWETDLNGWVVFKA